MRRIGVDIGGTFTDLVLLDDASGRWQVAKTLTTPAAPEQGVEHGLRELLAATGRAAGEIGGVIHGTTLVTNAIIERKGARTGLLTTAGFRDVLEIAREHRFDMYDLFLELPAPLVPRHRRLGVPERILDDGTVLEPLDEAALRRALQQLLDQGVEAVAIGFLHSYRNPAHERRAGELVRAAAPRLRLSLSSEVAPEIKEYDRFSTTVANVYVQPLVDRYLRTLGERLAALGFGGDLLIMLSSGGTATVETARRYPIRLVESGPAAGALAAAHLASAAGFPNVLAFDMGGTTAKACLIEQGRPLTSPQVEVARAYRFKPGSGLPVKVSVIELIEIGAGGGSLAHVDGLGLLQVGPESAGAAPGPACYGLGGTAPTVTDADLVLGYLDPDYFLGGRMRLDRAAAERAIAEQVARPLGLSLTEAAWGIHEVVNENMAAAARVHAIERGKDIRRFPLFAFGGAGPLHVYRLAQKLGATSFLCPLGAGATSALGLLVAPLAFDFVRSYYGPLMALDWTAVNALLDEMTAEGQALLGRAGVPAARIAVSRSVDLRYTGQGHEVPVSVPEGSLGPAGAPDILTRFDAEYRRLYGRSGPAVPVEAITWRVRVSGPPPAVSLERTDAGGAAAAARKGERPAYFAEARAYRPTPVYDRYALAPGMTLAGPAIVEERESTLVLGSRATARADASLNVIVDLETGG